MIELVEDALDDRASGYSFNGCVEIVLHRRSSPSLLRAHGEKCLISSQVLCLDLQRFIQGLLRTEDFVRMREAVQDLRCAAHDVRRHLALPWIFDVAERLSHLA